MRLIPDLLKLGVCDVPGAPGFLEALNPGWRQLPWPVDDNYLGRLKAYAGRVREAGLL